MLSNCSGLAAFLEARDDGFNVVIPADHPCFAQHLVRGHKVLPGVAYLDLALGAIRLKYPTLLVAALEDLVWSRPLLAKSAIVRAHVALEPVAYGRLRFNVRDDEGGLAYGWITTRPTMVGKWDTTENLRPIVVEARHRRFGRHAVYEAFSALGISYGPFFRRIEHLYVYKNQSISQLVEDDGVHIQLINLLDCAFQSSMAISIGIEVQSLMPFSLGALIAHERLCLGNERCYWVVTENITRYRTNIAIYSDDGRPLLSVRDLGVRPSRL